MPPLMKQSVPHILISMFVAPIMVTLFAWGNSKISDNSERSTSTSAQLPHIIKTIDEIHENQIHTNGKLDSMLVFAYENRADITALKVKANNCDNQHKYYETIRNVK